MANLRHTWKSRSNRSCLKKLPVLASAGAAAGALASSQTNAAITYNPLNITLDSASAATSTATINFPAIGNSTLDGTPAFTFTANTSAGITVAKASGYKNNGPVVNVPNSGSTIVSAIPAGGVISSSLVTAYPTNLTMISDNASTGQFTVAAGLQYIGLTNTAGSSPSTDNYGWIGFQTLSTGTDVSAKITGFALESNVGSPVVAGSQTSINQSALSFTGSAGNGVWDEANTVNWFNGSSASVFHDFDNVTLNDTANTGGQYNLTVNATGATINPGSVTVGSLTVNTTNTYKLSGDGIAGYFTLVKNGTGTLIIDLNEAGSNFTNLNQGNTVLTPNGSMAKTYLINVGVTNGSSATLTLQPATSGGILVRNFNSLKINNGLITVQPTAGGVAGSPYRSVVVVSGLSIPVTGKLDLNNNDLIQHGGTLAKTGDAYYAAMQVLLSSGYQGGWNGSTGIVSSTAAADTTHLMTLGSIENNVDGSTPLYSTFDGQTVGAFDTLVKYTYYGDANLDGKVDGSDYSLIDNAYLNDQDIDDNGNLSGWFNGDFNYDGVINGSDYTLIDNAFNRQGAQITSSIAAVSTAEIATSAAVPEPTSLALLAMGSTGLLAYRRRSVIC